MPLPTVVYTYKHVLGSVGDATTSWTPLIVGVVAQSGSSPNWTFTQGTAPVPWGGRVSSVEGTTGDCTCAGKVILRDSSSSMVRIGLHTSSNPAYDPVTHWSYSTHPKFTFKVYRSYDIYRGWAKKYDVCIDGVNVILGRIYTETTPGSRRFLVKATGSNVEFWVDTVRVYTATGVRGTSSLYLNAPLYLDGDKITYLSYTRSSASTPAGYYPTLCPYMSNYATIGTIATSTTVVTDTTTGDSTTVSDTTSVFDFKKIYCINGYADTTTSGTNSYPCAMWDDDIKLCALRSATYSKVAIGKIDPAVEGYTRGSPPPSDPHTDVGDLFDGRPIGYAGISEESPFFTYLSGVIGDGETLDDSGGSPPLIGWLQQMYGTVSERPYVNVNVDEFGLNMDATATGELGEKVSFMKYLSTVVGMDTEGRASFWKMLEHLHDMHEHQKRHGADEGYNTDSTNWGKDAGAGGCQAATLMQEFIGNEDIDGDGYIYGRDYKIIDDDEKPPMLKQIELQEDWNEDLWDPANNITWGTYLSNEGQHP